MCVCSLELYPNSVFWYGIGWYFLSIFLTDTKGKLGKDLRYHTFGGNPFFPRFCPLFDGPSPPFEGSSRKISQIGALAKSYSTKNTVHTILNTNRQVPVTYTDTGQTASKQMGYNSSVHVHKTQNTYQKSFLACVAWLALLGSRQGQAADA
jgi:hypothetical protein